MRSRRRTPVLRPELVSDEHAVRPRTQSVPGESCSRTERSAIPPIVRPDTEHTCRDSDLPALAKVIEEGPYSRLSRACSPSGEVDDRSLLVELFHPGTRPKVSGDASHEMAAFRFFRRIRQLVCLSVVEDDDGMGGFQGARLWWGESIRSRHS
jgi:hypothetical protein